MDLDGLDSQKQSEIDDATQVIKSPIDVPSILMEITKNEEQDDPFYVCDISDIIKRYEEWKAAMPRVATYYAVKCNDSRIVLEVLAALGIGFDCASKEEIRKVLSLGVQPDRIIFANPTKKISHLKFAAETAVTLMTFDSEVELQKIKKVYPSARLVIRIKYDDLSARYVLGQKYGCDHVIEAPGLLRVAASLGLNVVGVCFHIGSDSKDPLVFSKAIAAARHVFDVAANLGFKFKLLDIGGGYPGDKKKSIKEIGNIVNSALEKYFPDLSVEVISEPGRYYVNTAFTLATSINSVREAVQTDPETKDQTKVRMYYVDNSIYGALISIFCDEVYTPRPLEVDTTSPLRPSIVWGSTCDTCDKITKDVVLLPEMNISEWIFFEEAGAYTLSISCEFNGFATPKIHSVVDEEGWLKLTSQVPYPLSRDKFVIGNKPEYFRIGLTGPNKFKTNYF